MWLALFAIVILSAQGAVIQNLDNGWKFNFTTSNQPKLSDCTIPECSINYDDNTWKSITIPHDFVVLGVFNQNADMAHGYLPYAKGWYRKNVDLTVKTNDKVWLHFDGTQRNAVVFFNGKFLGNHLSGYTPHEYDVSALVQSTNNVIAVYVDATQPDGWWYDGGGIYRHVYFRISGNCYIDPLSVYVPTKVTSMKLTGESGSGIANAQVTASVTVFNEAATSFQGTVSFTVGSFPAVSKACTIGAHASQNVEAVISLPGVNLWSIETPNLLTAKITVNDGSSNTVDSIDQIFGVRDISFDANRGFLLNSQPVKIQGFANHQDFAGVGVAVPDSLQKFRVMKLKEMGANAWRTAHNPPNVALLNECDSQGFFVWDENHRNIAAGDQWVADLKALILRDRNHPSVIMWSICNEVLCQSFNATSAAILKSIIKENDPAGNRPVTAAMNGAIGSAFSDVLDVMGINYNIGTYDSFHRGHPNQPMIGSETASAVSDRGMYSTSATTKVVSAYDVNAPGWGNSAQTAMQAIWTRDFLSGDFVWTGFDYKGEPTPYNWPNINSHFGVVDISGYPKDAFYYYKSIWIPDVPTVHVFPHWNWNTGETVNVWVYSNAEQVQLILNNENVGNKQTVPKSVSSMGRIWRSHVEWSVKFAPGNITAVGYDSNGKVTTSDTRITAGNPSSIKLSIEFPENGQLKANGVDVALITATVVDSKGIVVPTATNVMQFALQGTSGIILGTGNGNPNSHEPDYPMTPQSANRSAFNGLARLVVQSTSVSGQFKVTASSSSLTSDQISITVQ